MPETKDTSDGGLTEGQHRALSVLSRFFRVPEKDVQKITQAIHVALSEWRAVVHGGKLRDGTHFVGLISLQKQTERIERIVANLDESVQPGEDTPVTEGAKGGDDSGGEPPV